MSSGNETISPARLARIVIPWVLLAVVLFRVFVIVGDYRDARGRGGNQQAGEPTATTGAPARPATTNVPGATPSTQATMVVVVLIDGLNLRTKPSSAGGVVKRLARGTRLGFLEKKATWYRVKSTDGEVGWVTADTRWTRLQKAAVGGK